MAGWNGLKATGFCYTCGSELKRQSNRPRKYYCNRECMDKRPPKQVLLEMKHDKPLRETITNELNRTGKVTMAADFLEMYPTELRKHMKRFGITKRIWFE